MAICAVISSGIAVLPTPVRAQALWTGAVSSDWNNPGNWVRCRLEAFTGRRVCDEPAWPGTWAQDVNPIIDTGQAVIDGDAIGPQFHHLVVGQAGNGALLVRNGGSLHSPGNIHLGEHGSGVGTVTVTGAGSAFTAGYTIRVGEYGSGRLEVLDGADVTAGLSAGANGGRIYVGTYAGSQGSILLDGGSTMTVANYGIGHGGEGEMIVRGGSRVVSTHNAYWGVNHIGYGVGSRGHVTITGEGSSWSIAENDLNIAFGVDSHGELVVADGGLLDVGVDSTVGRTRNASATVQVTGAGSRWRTQGGFLLAGGGSSGTVAVTDGGVLETGSATLGYASVDTGLSVATMTVSGDGSRWTNRGELRVGHGHTHATFNVLDGASADTSTAIVGYASSRETDYGIVVVSGDGSSWTVGELLRVGQGNGVLRIEDGGRVTATIAQIGYDGAGSGVVSGEGSTLAVTDLVDVGGLRGSGTLAIRDGGQVLSGSAEIGTQMVTGRSAHASVSGAGSLWRADGFLVGNQGVRDHLHASITLSDGGRVETGTLSLGNGGGVFIGGGRDAEGNLLAATGAGILDAAALVFRNPYFSTRATLTFNHTDADHVFATAMSGNGSIDHAAGTTRLTADSADFIGRSVVRGGTLLVDGTLGGTVDVQAGTFGGSGTVGDVSVADGATLSPGGMAVGTLTVGNLTLSDQSIVRFDLGTADAVAGEDNDLVEVTGNLVLDGQLHIDAAPAFGNGVYRLFNYGGTLTDNGLVFNTIMGGGDYDGADFGIQTAIGGQVSLVVGGIAAPILFWQGGSGIWDAESGHWTDANGTRNDNWGGTFAVFQGEGGTVTVVGEQDVTGLQFAADGYSVAGGEGGALRLVEPDTIIRIDPGNTARLSVALTGDSALVQRDTGTLVLSGNNSYTGGTQLFEGVLEAASDAALGAAQGNVTFRGGTLRVGDGFATSRGFGIGSEGGRLETSGNVRYNGMLSGSAAFHRIGGGVFDFAGDGSGYTGVFGSGGGRFNLSGVLGGLLDLASNATLSGTGRAHDLRIGGRLAPGNSIGTLLADGDVTFLPGSVFEVEVAANGSSDLLQVSGSVDIQGGTVEVLALDPHRAYTDGQQYTFLTAAGGLTGTFSGVTDDSAFLDFTLGYTGTSALLTLTRVATFPEVAQTWNQVQSSTGLRDLGSSGDALAVYNTLLMLDAPSARSAFDAASGEIHAGNQQAMAAAGHAFNRTLLRQPDAEGAGLWLAGVYDSGKIEGDGNAVGLDRRVEGIAFGYGAGASSDSGGWTLGGAIGTTRTRADMDGRASRARGDAWHVGVYGKWSRGAWDARGALGYMDGDADIGRGIAFGGLARNAVATQDMAGFGFSGELAWRMTEGTLAVAPLLTVDAVRANFDATRESGADALDLSLARQRHEQLDVGAGVRLSGALGNGGYELRAVYVQDVGSDRTAERSGLFAGSPTAFTVRGPEADKSRVRLVAGISYPVTDAMSLGLRYEGTFAGSGDAHGAMARFDWRF